LGVFGGPGRQVCLLIRGLNTDDENGQKSYDDDKQNRNGHHSLDQS
jgi:hypothetical protein